MASLVEHGGDGQQLDLGRDSWLSNEAQRWLAEAMNEPKIGRQRVLTMILHNGLGIPLSMIAELLGETKNVIAKNVISGKKRMKKVRYPQREVAVDAGDENTHSGGPADVCPCCGRPVVIHQQHGDEPPLGRFIERRTAIPA
ncbi:MAG: hypothetical protein KF777_01060 [Planctomycetaceae bacterium]|nr:hypothetical protein [Planctomycetaceae bacterium]